MPRHVVGKIERIAYHKGAFVSADLDKASESNERNGFVIATTKGRVGVVQIAGLVARRILCFVREGATVGAGERIGMIRFGSRVDVYLPEGAKAVVAEGLVAQRVVTGEIALGIQQLSEILAVPDAVLIGPIPQELQAYTTFSAGISAAAREPALARALIDRLTDSEVRALAVSKGLEPF